MEKDASGWVCRCDVNDDAGYYWKGMGQQEIADAFNTSQPNIRQRLRRIHKKLAGLME